MSRLREEMVLKAKAEGICTQCLKNKATTERLQCQRCIDTNKRKRDKRKAKYDEYQTQTYDRKLNNPYRRKMIDHAIKIGVCTKCFGRPVNDDMRQCDICLERKRRWAVDNRRKIGKRKRSPTGTQKTMSPEERRKKAREYRQKVLAKKIRNLDKISHAVAENKSIK